MNSFDVLFLRTPVPYIIVLYLFLYYHDPLRFLHPIGEDTSEKNRASVLAYLGLVPKPASEPARSLKRLYLLLAGALVSSALSLALPLLFEGRPFYYLPVSQLLAALPFMVFLVPVLGPLPRRPRATHLRYPRLGTMVKHYARRGSNYTYTAMPAADGGKAEVGGGKDADVVFFNVALKDFHPMSVPVCEPPQTLVGETIHAMERDDPRFAWVQFLFVFKDHSRSMSRIKEELHSFKGFAETKDVTYEGVERERKELGEEWYRQVDRRAKKIEEALTQSNVLVAIQGMWVGEGQGCAQTVRDLPFSRCADEFDRLEEFLYRDPRMLVNLVERTMVTDIGKYLERYGSSRAEAPSFILTPEALPYYVHFPTGMQAKTLATLNYIWRPTTQLLPGSFISDMANWKEAAGGEGEGRGEPGLSVARLTAVPLFDDRLPDKETARLQHVVCGACRSFEMVYDGKAKRTEFLLSSEDGDDLEKYVSLLMSVYGPIKYEHADPRPGFLAELPALMAKRRPRASPLKEGTPSGAPP